MQATDETPDLPPEIIEAANPTAASLFDLTGKVAIVTGGGRGIGRAMAEALAEQGALVVICGRTLATVEAAAAEMRARGLAVEAQRADVGHEPDVIALRDAVMTAQGRIDILVNNAGINPIYRGIEKTSLDDFNRICTTNLTGIFLCCKYLGGEMAAAGAGSIINVTSIAGHVGLLKSVPYCAAKGGAELLTKALALDWAPKGVRVNSLAPGYVETDLTAGLVGHEELSAQLLAQVPQSRYAQPRDMAGAVVFLASDASAFMTGQSLVVDGGWTAR
ncbi:SDR family NAD(P)-dependent oxidoreductase [Acidisphaera rubrifaciens]|uniref:Oxidoreductase/short-chain dehydrogenase/reductase SDR n=1 Tax=Acidisphaera rubrifaciens HS-AP3 TaxID=1231350 RepID=A0A0D6P9V2_9PROT|nr:glucose 1-dehydrogenase [Acidisphaera rubrifaciens]GAN78447.1 oxidoreductase/short-chain dehydrogenase/reductase SDR [Acidisphaera rubrifaciens HS-AP3]